MVLTQRNSLTLNVTVTEPLLTKPKLTQFLFCKEFLHQILQEYIDWIT